VIEDVVEPIVAYTGDTTIKGLFGVPVLLEVETLIMELTFLCDNVMPNVAVNRGHIHLYQFASNIERFHNRNIIFTHFSARYELQEIIQNIEKKITPKEGQNYYVGFEGKVFKLFKK